MKTSTLSLWLKPENFKIVAFYPYTSIICNKILGQDHNYKTEEHDFVQAFADAIALKAKEIGIRMDNKVVIELQFIKSVMPNPCSNIFVGYKDNLRHIGLGVWQPDEYTKESNQKF